MSSDMIAAADAAAETSETNGKPKLFQEFWLWKMTLRIKKLQTYYKLIKEPQKKYESNYINIKRTARKFCVEWSENHVICFSRAWFVSFMFST